MKKSEIEKEMQSYSKLYTVMIEKALEEAGFIRDWFAAQAISYITRNAHELPVKKEFKEAAKYAYGIADAMMEERAKRKTKKHAR